MGVDSHGGGSIGRRTLAQKIDRLFKTVLSPDGDEYTYREVADAMDKLGGPRISPTVVWRLRMGEQDDPRTRQLEAVAKCFSAPVEYFFDDEAAANI